MLGRTARRQRPFGKPSFYSGQRLTQGESQKREADFGLSFLSRRHVQLLRRIRRWRGFLLALRGALDVAGVPPRRDQARSLSALRAYLLCAMASR